MKEGYQTGFQPNRAQRQRVQSNSITSLRTESSLKGMGVGLIAKETDILHCEERFLIRMEKTEKRTYRKGIPLGAPPANIEMHKADLYLKRKMQEMKTKISFGSVRYADGEYSAEQSLQQ